jgi:hypothetical protein
LACRSGNTDLGLITRPFSQLQLSGDFLFLAERAGINRPSAEAFADQVHAHLVVAPFDHEANTRQGIIFQR